MVAHTPEAPPPPPDAVTVTTPAETGVTDRLVEKLIVPAVPTADPLSCTTTPEPEPITLVNPEPSPTNAVAVTTPLVLTDASGVNAVAGPSNLVALKVPFEELKVKLVFVFGAKSPVGAVANTGKQVVSLDSFPNVISEEAPVRSPVILPTKEDAVTTPV